MSEPTGQARNELSAEALADWCEAVIVSAAQRAVTGLTVGDTSNLLRIAALLRAGQKLYLTAEGCPHCCNDDGVNEWEAAHD